MCGICGIIDTNGIEPELIISMRDSMEHRGPDNAGYWISPNKQVALGHRRLSIIDLSDNAHQPMSNEDGNITIVYNGEIYNYIRLRNWLKAKGHTFKSNSDTEVIIHLYEEYGTDCVDKLDGMFAFAIWDSRHNVMLLARDKIGKKPLYYTYCKNKLIFASEIKSILQHPDVKKELNFSALYDYLTLYVSVAPTTLFKGISKLAAGHKLFYTPGTNPIVTRYWDLQIETAKDYSEDEFIVSIRYLLKKSIQKRMMSDVPYGVFLSGGLDSSLNVALMSELSHDPINTFTVGFEGQPKYDEFNYAKQVATQFKTNHHEHIISEKDVLDFIPKMVHYQDEPLADWVCVPLYYVSKLASDNGVKTIQLGEGSDELFFGYDGYVSYLNVYKYFWKHYMKLPQSIRNLAYSALAPMSPFIGTGPGIKEIFRCATDNEELFWGGAVSFSESQKREFVERNDLNTFDSILPYYYRIDKKSDFIQKMMYIEFKHRLPELLLMRVDKMAMASSVECRAPYLDIDLVEYVSKMPSKYKYKNGEKKYILKKVAEGLLPNEIIYRKKQGFSTPVKEWFNGKLGKYMIDVINKSRLADLGIFDYYFINRMITDQLSGKSDNSAKLWSLYNLSEWYSHWFK